MSDIMISLKEQNRIKLLAQYLHFGLTDEQKKNISNNSQSGGSTNYKLFHFLENSKLDEIEEFFINEDDSELDWTYAPDKGVPITEEYKIDERDAEIEKSAYYFNILCTEEKLIEIKNKAATAILKDSLTI